MAASLGGRDPGAPRAARVRSADRRHCQPQARQRRSGTAQECAVRLPVPPHARRRGTDLFNQQMWCWGCDVRRAEGNLLLAYGFERQAPSPDTRYKSAYLLRLGPQQACALWGFGMHFLDETAGALFLKRFGFAPELLTDVAAPEQVFEPAHLSPPKPLASSADVACARELLVTALRWIAAYEAWVMETTGVEHRRQALDSWRAMRKRVVAEPDALVDAWNRLADECAGVETGR